MSRTRSDKVYPRSWLLALQCGCQRRVLQEAAPTVHEQIHCFRHNRVVGIVGVSSEYGVRCLDCSSRKLFGRAKLAAQFFADAHHRKQPTHRVQIRDGDKVIEIRAPKIFMETLPFGVVEPPF